MTRGSGSKSSYCLRFEKVAIVAVQKLVAKE
jgi:hypothetical protein